MSRRIIIGGIVAAGILVLTAVAYLVTTSNLETRLRADVRDRVERAQHQLIQNASFEGLQLLKQVEAQATRPRYAELLAMDGNARSEAAEREFQDFIQSLKPGEERPDIIALTDDQGELVVQRGVADPLPKKWMDRDGKPEYPGLTLALDQRYFLSEVWNFRSEGLMRVGVGPIVDAETDSVVGTLVLGYPITSKQAREQASALGAEVALFYSNQVAATSFTRGAGAEDTEIQARLSGALATEELGKKALERSVGDKPPVISVAMAGASFVVTAARLPRFSSKAPPADYPMTRAGAMVTMSLTEVLAPLTTIKVSILLLGLVAFVLAILANIITARSILHQADEIEDGINDIIQGNFDRHIRAVGAELDGLAHALNVMLARLLGRPEPGEEEYDDDGNLVQPSRVDFENEELANLSPADDAAMALAQEPEPAYYSRLFNEYVEAREQVGESTESMNYENFITKLRLNESNLKVKYQCRAVRFRVVVKDNKVTLKPVPIV